MVDVAHLVLGKANAMEQLGDVSEQSRAEQSRAEQSSLISHFAVLFVFVLILLCFLHELDAKYIRYDRIDIKPKIVG